jgi:hypothetical protein
MISAKIIADSINPAGSRLTTFEIVFNRWILAELNTHRMLSRNSASSRAIPIKRLLSAVWQDPAYPVSYGSNKAGMQAGSDLTGWRLWCAKKLFRLARIPALISVWFLSKFGLHKQVANRILEPWMWHTAIVSGTDWENFFKLRDHKDAQPEFQVLARCMRIEMITSSPVQVGWLGWHLPYIPSSLGGKTYGITDGLLDTPKISAACCARVSYVRQNDRKSEAEDVALANKLTSSGHFSPLEHPAVAIKGYNGGNFNGGWKQLRKFYSGEDGCSKSLKCTCTTINNIYSDDCEFCNG